MNNNFRYILAGVLIFLIIMLQPVYLKWLGYETSPETIIETKNLSETIIQQGSNDVSSIFIAQPDIFVSLGKKATPDTSFEELVAFSNKKVPVSIV